MGTLLKIIIFGIAIYIIYSTIKKYFKKTSSSSSQPPEDVMLACHSCGTFVESNDAILKDGHYYCSKECAKL